MYCFSNIFFSHVDLETQGLARFLQRERERERERERDEQAYNVILRARDIRKLFGNLYMPQHCFLQWGGFFYQNTLNH